MQLTWLETPLLSNTHNRHRDAVDLVRDSIALKHTTDTEMQLTWLETPLLSNTHNRHRDAADLARDSIALKHT